jgi:hypothetical protein
VLEDRRIIASKHPIKRENIFYKVRYFFLLSSVFIINEHSSYESIGSEADPLKLLLLVNIHKFNLLFIEINIYLHLTFSSWLLRK